MTVNQDKDEPGGIDKMTHHPKQVKQPKRNRGTGKRIRLLGVTVVSLTIWACYTIYGQLDIIKAKSSELQMLDDKLAEAIQLNEDAKKEINRMNEKEYKEEQIRTYLHYAKPGETIFDIPKTSP
jgi:cell division protein DivIC